MSESHVWLDSEPVGCWVKISQQRTITLKPDLCFGEGGANPARPLEQQVLGFFFSFFSSKQTVRRDENRMRPSEVIYVEAKAQRRLCHMFDLKQKPGVFRSSQSLQT